MQRADKTEGGRLRRDTERGLDRVKGGGRENWIYCPGQAFARRPGSTRERAGGTMKGGGGQCRGLEGREEDLEQLI